MRYFEAQGLHPVPALANQSAISSPLDIWDRVVPSPMFLGHSERVWYETSSNLCHAIHRRQTHAPATTAFKLPAGQDSGSKSVLPGCPTDRTASTCGRRAARLTVSIGRWIHPAQCSIRRVADPKGNNLRSEATYNIIEWWAENTATQINKTGIRQASHNIAGVLRDAPPIKA